MVFFINGFIVAACLLLPSYDTLDRDPLSADYQKHLPQFLPIDDGLNHIVFNLYSGSWPNYLELDFSNFNPGKAILIKASSSYQNYRKDFDVSLPLFSKNHPIYGQNKEIESNPKNLLVFKGKRYIYGIGSETRNSLHHLHNNNDILIYTTCKHGKKWKELRDDRCENDNQFYDKFDYQSLMANSTFCLVPRGRRLGSFRFLEALSLGCIPVVLSNSWVLPFSEVIDWSSAVIMADERLLLQIPEQIRSISKQKLISLRSKCLSLYENYFSSVERIVKTTLTIIEERIELHLSRSLFLWNLVNPGLTGAIWFDYKFSDDLKDFPGYSSTYSGFTAIVSIDRPVLVSTIMKLIKNTLIASKFNKHILLIWSTSSVVPSSLLRLPSSLVTIIEANSSKAKLVPYPSIATDAVFQLDPETSIIAEEVNTKLFSVVFNRI